MHRFLFATLHSKAVQQISLVDLLMKQVWKLRKGPKLCIPTLTINHYFGGREGGGGGGLTQEVNLWKSSPTIRGKESRVGVGVDCNRSDSIDKQPTEQITIQKPLFEQCERAVLQLLVNISIHNKS